MWLPLSCETRITEFFLEKLANPRSRTMVLQNLGPSTPKAYRQSCALSTTARFHTRKCLSSRENRSRVASHDTIFAHFGGHTPHSSCAARNASGSACRDG